MSISEWWRRVLGDNTDASLRPTVPSIPRIVDAPKGYALCLGVNAVDPAHYGGWSGPLQGCEHDALGMSRMLKRKGYVQPRVLLTRDAKADAVLGHLGDLARVAQPGDIVCVTSSSHGGQVPDYDGDEFDRQDETICMYDRQIVDDELELAWSWFRRGVRILFVSDSCHSGTMMRGAGRAEPLGSKALPVDVAQRTAAEHHVLYRDIHESVRARAAESGDVIKASVLSLSACADNQTAMDGTGNGLFTGSLLMHLTQYPAASLGSIRSRVGRDLGALQSPQYVYGGARSDAFERSPAFSI